MSRRRARAQGRAEHGERFAMIPDWLLQEPSVIDLAHSSFRVLVIVTAQCWISRDGRSGQNGLAALSGSHAQQFGLSSRDTLYGALRELSDEKQLLVRTREGLKMRKMPALYAVAWLPITHEQGRPLEVWRDAPHGYRAWRDGSRPVPDSGNATKKFRTGFREQCVPESGNDRPGPVPNCPPDAPKAVPESGNTSRFSGGTHTAPPACTASSTLTDERATRACIAALIADPSLTPERLAERARVPLDWIRPRHSQLAYEATPEGWNALHATTRVGGAA